MNKRSKIKFNIWLLSTAIIIIFAALINLNRTYKSEVDVLIIPKDKAILENIDQIANNAREIPKTLFFYNRILSGNESIFDEVSNFPNSERKSFWMSKVRTERVNDSSMLKIIIFDKNQLRAEELSQQAGLEMAKIMSQQYNIKTELDVRIADGPISSYGLKKGIVVIILESIFWGILATLSVFVINQGLESLGAKNGSGKAKSLAAIRKFTNIVSKVEAKPISFDKKPSGLEKKQSETKTDLGEKKVVYDLEKKAAAPYNLPVGDFSEFSSVGKSELKIEKKQENKNEPVIREATPEEVKERLNKLLKGEM